MQLQAFEIPRKLWETMKFQVWKSAVPYSDSSFALLRISQAYAILETTTILAMDGELTTTSMGWVLSIICHRKSNALGRRQRYKNVVIAKKMLYCQLLVWSQLTVSEGFGGITYCLADSNFGVLVSHGSVIYYLICYLLSRSKQHAHCIYSTYIFVGARCAACLLHFYIM